MPTIAKRPTLRETQAVGVTLLHQFARERFREAGIRDDSLIREAEANEDLDLLASALLHDEILDDESNTTTTTNVNCSSNHNETSNTSMRLNGSNANNTTVLEAAGDNQNGSLITEERFHSMAESSVANETRQEDRTMYHSINGGDNSEASSAFDRLQASPRLAAYGRELRRMADEFEQSRLRQTVKESAESVNLFDITRKDFIDLLEVLFHGKITREKVVILFFFCTDAALYAVRELSKYGPEQMRQLVIKLLGWSFSYIINTFSSFIVKLGGWDKVLFYQFPSLLISCCAALAMVSLVVYLKKNLLRGAT